MFRVLIFPPRPGPMVLGVRQALVEVQALVSEGAQARSYTEREPLPKPWIGSDCSLPISTVQPPTRRQLCTMQIINSHLEIRSIGFTFFSLRTGRVCRHGGPDRMEACLIIFF